MEPLVEALPELLSSEIRVEKLLELDPELND
jgi:hypothetical protein